MSEPTNLTLPLSSPSSSSTNLYSISVNWQDSLDYLYPTMGKLDRPPDESGEWERLLKFPIVKKDGISPRKNGGGFRVVKRVEGMRSPTVVKRGKKSLDERVKDWAKKKVDGGAPESGCRLHFLEKGPKQVECCLCSKFIYSDKVLCSVSSCKEVYHLKCAKENIGFTASRSFKCPQHACFICKQIGSWRCIQCTISSHSRCAPWPDRVRSTSQPRQAVCWRHPSDWRLDKKPSLPSSDIEGIFGRLPLPYTNEEFSIDALDKDIIYNEKEPIPYLRIRRNVYLVKKKHNFMDGCSGCTDCDASGCDVDCVCRVQCISCSKDCRCSEMCTNRPFHKEKKVKVAMTKHCGWGVEACEAITEGDFVIEYIGEVIDDALCEQRFWCMKERGDTNFYLCEIRKDFIIDATYKGNLARFVNHSCDPNCRMEKWEVDGETRVGIFALRTIEVGEHLTYDYRFVCFGSEVKCHCGASNCQGYLGAKKKIDKVVNNLHWRCKRRRSTYWEMKKHELNEMDGFGE